MAFGQKKSGNESQSTKRSDHFAVTRWRQIKAACHLCCPIICFGRRHWRICGDGEIKGQT